MTKVIRRRHLGVPLLACGLAWSLSGCVSSYATLLEDLDGSVGRIFVCGPNGTVELNQPGFGMALDGAGQPFAISPEKFDRDFEEALSAMPIPPKRFLLFAGTADGYLTADSQRLLTEIEADIKRRSSAEVAVIGFDDGDGLAAAKTVERALLEKGVKVSDITTVAHGEEYLLPHRAAGARALGTRQVIVSVR